MKIAVIGPSYPFRGGIAHYTTYLCKNLEKKDHTVRLFSFSRLYLSLIFPGTSQEDKKSEKRISFPSKNTIDTINPLSWISTFKHIKKYNPDLVIFQWWTSLLSPVYFSLSQLIKRFTKIKVLFLCHNVYPHERILSNKGILRITYSVPDFFITHSEEDKKNLQKLTKNKIIKVSPHPTYKHFKYKEMSKKAAKRKLKLRSKNILLFFGYVKKYKGLIYLIKALKYIPPYFDFKLLVVGEFYEKKDLYTKEIKKLGLQDKVIIIDKYIPNESVGLYFSAADVVICPYVTATQSGIIQITYGFDKPVIASKVGGLPEIVKEGETGYLVKKCDSKELAKSVIKFFKNKNKIDFKKNIQNIQYKFSWDRMVDVIKSFNEK